MTSVAPVRARLAVARRVIVGVIVVAFGLAAVLGIIVLLGVELGEAAGRVLATTAIVGVFSVAVLCGAALLGRRVQAVGIATVAAAVVSAALSVWSVWTGGFSGAVWDALMRVMWSGCIVTAALSIASLLLLLADRRRAAVRFGLIATLVALAILLALSLWLVWGRDLGDGFSRVYGIVAILTALGAVVVPVLSLLLPDTRAVAVSPALAQRLGAEAARRGITVDELVAPVLPAPNAPVPPASDASSPAP